MPIPLALVLPTITALKGLGKKDNSSNWKADNWGWWLERDPSSNPAGNFLIWLDANPSFLKQYPEKVPIVISRLSKEGYDTAIHAILIKQGIEQASDAKSAVVGAGVSTNATQAAGGTAADVGSSTTPASGAAAGGTPASVGGTPEKTNYLLIGGGLLALVAVVYFITKGKKK